MNDAPSPLDEFLLPDLPHGANGTYWQTDPIPLGAIQLLPAHNVSRNGAIDPPQHPDVARIVRSLAATGSTLMHCVGLRPEIPPIPRPCPGPCCTPAAMARDGALAPVHLYSARYGFRRLIACLATGRTHLFPARSEVKLLVEDDGTPWSDARCGDANLIENTARGNSTDFQLSVAVADFHRSRGMPIEEIAQRLGEHPQDVCDRILIVERCPLPLKAAWARRPTKEVRRALAKIARHVDPEDRWPLERRHATMVDAWAQFEAETTAAKAPPATPTPTTANAAGPPAPPWLGRRKPAAERPPQPVPKRLVGAAVATLRGVVDTATEVHDPAAGWRPLTPGERAFAQMLLGALARGDGGAVLR